MLATGGLLLLLVVGFFSLMLNRDYNVAVQHMVRDYAVLGTRKRDIRLDAANTTVSEWIVKVPAGSKVTGLPQGGGGSSNFGTYKVDVESSASEVRVKTSIALTKTRIRAAESGRRMPIVAVMLGTTRSVDDAPTSFPVDNSGSLTAETR